MYRNCSMLENYNEQSLNNWLSNLKQKIQKNPIELVLMQGWK